MIEQETIADKITRLEDSYNKKMTPLKAEVKETVLLLKNNLKELEVSLVERQKRSRRKSNISAKDPFAEFLGAMKDIALFASTIEEKLEKFPYESIGGDIAKVSGVVVEYINLYYQYNQREDFQNQRVGGEGPDDKFQDLLARPWQLLMKFPLFYKEASRIVFGCFEKIAELTDINPGLYTKADFLQDEDSSQTKLKIEEIAASILKRREYARKARFLEFENDEIVIGMQAINGAFDQFLPQIANLVGAFKINKLDDVSGIIKQMFDGNNNDSYEKNVDYLMKYATDWQKKEITNDNIVNYIVILWLLNLVCLNARNKNLTKIGQIEVDRLESLYDQIIIKLDQFIDKIYLPVSDQMTEFSKKMAIGEVIQFKMGDEAKGFFESCALILSYMNMVTEFSTDKIGNLRQKLIDQQDQLINFARGGSVQKRIVDSIVHLLSNEGKVDDVKKYIKSELGQQPGTEEEERVVLKELKEEREARSSVEFEYRLSKDRWNIVALLALARMFDRFDKKHKDLYSAIARATGFGSQNDNIQDIFRKLDEYFGDLYDKLDSMQNLDEDKINQMSNYIQTIDAINGYAERMFEARSNSLFKDFFDKMNQRRQKAEDLLIGIASQHNKQDLEQNPQLLKALKSLLQENIKILITKKPEKAEKMMLVLNGLPSLKLAPSRTISSIESKPLQPASATLT